MGGVGSGRKSRFDDLKIAQLAEMSVLWALNNFEKLSNDDKMKILTTVAAKYIVQRVGGEGLIQNRLIIIRPDGKQNSTENSKELSDMREEVSRIEK
jgi:hypothetical protein